VNKLKVRQLNTQPENHTTVNTEIQSAQIRVPSMKSFSGNFSVVEMPKKHLKAGTKVSQGYCSHRM